MLSSWKLKIGVKLWLVRKILRRICPYVHLYKVSIVRNVFGSGKQVGSGFFFSTYIFSLPSFPFGLMISVIWHCFFVTKLFRHQKGWKTRKWNLISGFRIIHHTFCWNFRFCTLSVSVFQYLVPTFV